MNTITAIAKCSLCGNQEKILLSNNPLVKGLCFNCLKQKVDHTNIKIADHFCKTYNIPFLPEKWITMSEELGSEMFETYVSVIADENHNCLYNSSATALLWEKMDETYQKIKDHRVFIGKIAEIQEGFEEMMSIKWGPRYTLEQFMRLENLYNSTVSKIGAANSLTLDVIKKIAMVSVQIDESLDQGDIKGAAELSKMHASLIKSSGLDDMVEVTGGDVINNISDLCNYLEDCGFQFTYYDGVTRDIVDKTIANQQSWTTSFIRDCVGFDQDYEMVKNSFEQALEENKTAEAITENTLEDIIKRNHEAKNSQFDSEFIDDLEEMDLGDVNE